MLQLGTPALVGADGERVELPDAVFLLLNDIVRNMQPGRAVVLIPENQQLTTQLAADLPGVSRPYLIKLLEAGDLPYHKAGSHRRVYLKDLISIRRQDCRRGGPGGPLHNGSPVPEMVGTPGLPAPR